MLKILSAQNKTDINISVENKKSPTKDPQQNTIVTISAFIVIVFVILLLINYALLIYYLCQFLLAKNQVKVNKNIGENIENSVKDETKSEMRYKSIYNTKTKKKNPNNQANGNGDEERKDGEIDLTPYEKCSNVPVEYEVRLTLSEVNDE